MISKRDYSLIDYNLSFFMGAAFVEYCLVIVLLELLITIKVYI